MTGLQTTALRGALALACALTMFEAVVRMFHDVRVTHAEGIGYVNAPGTARYGLEGYASSTWLEKGERWTPDRPAEAPAVLVLGDSFTEAIMIPDEATFVAVAQRRVNAASVRLRLVNAGRSRASVADYVGLAQRFRSRFPSTWTVVELRSDDLGSDAWVATRPHFLRTEDGGLTVDPTAEAPPTGWRAHAFVLRQRSALLNFAFVRAGQFRQLESPPLFFAGGRRPEPPRAVTYPVRQELEALDAAWGGRVTLLYLSDVLAGDPHESAVRAHCAETARSCVFTRDENLRLLERGKAPTGFMNTAWGEGHLNEDGHAVAGALLGAELVRLAKTLERDAE